MIDYFKLMSSFNNTTYKRISSMLYSLDNEEEEPGVIAITDPDVEV